MPLVPRSAAATLLIALGSTTLVAQAASPARVDTVDVAPGSRHVDFSKHTPGVSRAVQTRLVGEQSTALPVVLWTFAFTDTGGRALLHVRSQPERPGAGPGAPSTYAVFDRKTLALSELHMGAAPGPHANLVVTGNTVRGVMAVPAGPPGSSAPNGPPRADSVNVTLSAPPFFGPLVDLIVESLPHAPGMVYRVPLWRPGTNANEVRLYETVRREDIEVLGHAYRSAYVVEERSGDAKQLLGTMWIVDHPPFLVRWIINRPDGSSLRLDQEAAK